MDEVCHPLNYDFNLKLLQNEIIKILKKSFPKNNNTVEINQCSEEMVKIIDGNNVLDFHRREMYKAKVRVGIKEILKNMEIELDNELLTKITKKIMDKIDEFGILLIREQ